MMNIVKQINFQARNFLDLFLFQSKISYYSILELKDKFRVIHHILAHICVTVSYYSCTFSEKKYLYPTRSLD
jgi:hypothetical protein